MNPLSLIQKPRTHKTCKIEGGSRGESNLIYAAKFTKCHVLNMGQTRN